MINNTVLVGRLTKKPQLKHTNSNIAFSRFTVAVNRPFKDNQSGEYETDFISCIAWRKQAENLCRFTDKGKMVGVTGRIQTGSYDKDGRTIYTTDIVADSIQFLEPKDKQPTPEPKPTREPTIDVKEDNLPF